MAIEVQTTQNVVIDYEPAGLGSRTLANIIDWGIMAVWILLWVGIYIIAGQKMHHIYNIFESNLLTIVIFLILAPVVFYHLAFEIYNNGQSPGKRICKIKVVNTDGSVPTYSSFAIRWMFRLIDIYITEAMVSIIMIVTTKKSQRLGDYLAGTTVISLKTKSKNIIKAIDLDFQDNYVVTYPDLLNRISDRDVQTIISIISDQNMSKTEYFCSELAKRMKAVTGYSYEGPDRVFLKKIVDDYNFLSLQYS